MAPTRLYVAAALCAVALGNASSAEAQCADPVGAVLATMKCIEDEDVKCTETAYDTRKFKKYHNQVDTKTKLTSWFGSFWGNAFKYTDFKLDFDLSQNTGPNECEVRYVETVTTTSGEELGKEPQYDYPYAQAIKQYEHAIVKVDDNCRIIRWDQTGDDYEQGLVTTTVDDLLCKMKVLPFFLCFGKNKKTSMRDEDAAVAVTGNGADYTTAVGVGSAAGAAAAVMGVAAFHYKSKARVVSETAGMSLASSPEKFEL